MKSNILSKVIDFCRQHHDSPMKVIEKPLKYADMHSVVDEWDADFVDIEQEVLFELILAANYLDIKPLLELTCAKVASLIKGKTKQEIRETFNIIDNDEGENVEEYIEEKAYD